MLPMKLYQRILYSFGRTVNPTVNSKVEISPSNNQTTIVVEKDKYRNLHTEGPQLRITQILLLNGPLTSREIWRSYIRSNQQKQQKNEQFEDYFKSLRNLKRTLGFMRTNGKIRSNGYDRKRKQFKGWKINEQRSLKYVHPRIKQQIQAEIKRRNEL